MESWWINGQRGDAIGVTDRGLAYGDGLFETIAVRSGAPRFLALHLDRLLAGCERLGIPPPDRAYLHRELSAAAAPLPHGTLKLLLTRGPGPRGYAPPEDPAPTLIWGTATTRAVRSAPIAVRWCATMTAWSPATAGLKTLGRLEQVLARAEWSGTAIEEGLMRDPAGRLTGGTASNVFLVTAGHLLTPAVVNAGIAGVMRRVVIGLAGAHGLRLDVTDLRAADVDGADEIFVTNALTGIRPVRQLGPRGLATGPVTQQLLRLLAAAGVSECAAVS